MEVPPPPPSSRETKILFCKSFQLDFEKKKCFSSQINTCIKHKHKIYKNILIIRPTFKIVHDLVINVLAVQHGLNAYIL